MGTMVQAVLMSGALFPLRMLQKNKQHFSWKPQMVILIGQSKCITVSDLICFSQLLDRLLTSFTPCIQLLLLDLSHPRRKMCCWCPFITVKHFLAEVH